LIISHYAQNVTLSSMSHLVYITLFGETEGVTLSRLGCSYFGSCPRSEDFGVGKVNSHETTKEETFIIDEHV